MREAVLCSFWFLLLVLVCGSLGIGGLVISNAQQMRLDPGEVVALRQIASKLQVGFWNFSVDPCSGTGGWLRDSADSNVLCNCSTTSSICHVISIQLKSQNLRGVLPAEFANLTSLVQIDLSRNYINGSIPPEWGSLPLINVSLLGNRLTGPIPNEIEGITTLQSLVLENNLFGGPLPAALGKLTNLSRLLLSANNFTGELPEALGNLKSLQDL